MLLQYARPDSPLRGFSTGGMLSQTSTGTRMTLSFLVRPLAFALGLSAVLSAGAQNPCGAPPVASPTVQPNIFSAEQEEWLGEAMADVVESDFRLLKDPSQNAYLQAIADRLSANLPPSGIKYRVVLVDSSEVNGFSLAGGHIYITRKLAAAAENEDEIATVIGHEIGHIASHQFAFETTRDLKRLLGITSVGDRADVYDKFRKLMTARLTDKHPLPGGDSDSKQDEADHIGVYAAAAAGYRPQANAEFWNRVFFVRGRTGSRISDFFGITKPDEKRLRLLQTMATALPAGCGGTYKADAEAFVKWRKAVTENQAGAVVVDVAGAKSVKLNPPLHMDLDRVHFSRDGKTLLAQDAGSVFAVAADTNEMLFRFDADNALRAEFSPDSRSIVFATPGMHTEQWSVADRKLESARELIFAHPCLEIQLSPDGRTMICVWMNPEVNFTLELNLTLLDVATGAVVFEKKPFFSPSFVFALAMALVHSDEIPSDLVPSSITPDGNTLLIGPGDSKLAIDLRTRTPIKISGDVKNWAVEQYAFVSDDRLLVLNRANSKNSGLVSFPDGRSLKKIDAHFSSIYSTSNDDSDNFVLLGGLKDFEVGLADLDTAKIVMGSKTPALDMRNGSIVGENVDGSVYTAKLTIGNAHTNQLTQIKVLNLPLSPLSREQSTSLSRDGRYLAVSSRTRGAVWDTQTGNRVTLLRGFKSSSWSDDGTMYAQFTKPERAPDAKKPDELIAMYSPSKNSSKSLDYKLDDGLRMRYGLLMEWKEGAKHSWVLTMHNLADNSVTWTRTFSDGAPRYTRSFGERDLIFNSPTSYSEVKAKIKADSALSGEAANIKVKEDGRLVEIVNAETGKTEAQMVLQLPLNFNGTDGLNRAGDLLYVTGADDRTMVYSLQTGKQLREIFGRVVALDPDTGKVCVANRRDETMVYDAEGKELAHYHLGAPLHFAHFKDKGKGLVMLSADQTLWAVDSIEKSGTQQAAR
ncbi:MAG TPA: M48 family metalloprotease [Acidobacteriaceae bacterium]|jgi:predicted Zn-dependent protease